MNLKEILKSYLEDAEYDGFYNLERNCCCDINDLLWCGASSVRDCQPGIYAPKEFWTELERKQESDYIIIPPEYDKRDRLIKEILFEINRLAWLPKSSVECEDFATFLQVKLSKMYNRYKWEWHKFYK